MGLSVKPLSLLAALMLAAASPGCAPSASAGHTAASDGVKFDYAMTPVADPKSAHGSHVVLDLSDAGTGAKIPGATVAVNVFGPGFDGGTSVNLVEGTVGSYSGDITLPKAAAYNLTFQANRKAPAPSAQAVFSVTRPGP